MEVLAATMQIYGQKCVTPFSSDIWNVVKEEVIKIINMNLRIQVIRYARF